MLNKIYRGGVHRTTPETLECMEWSGSALLPGTAVTVDATDESEFIKGVTGIRDFFYIVGEALHGGVADDYNGAETSVRAYVPRSGDLYAVRAAAGLTLVDGMPLTINSDGRFSAATAGTAGDPNATPPVFPTQPSRVDAYVHYPRDSSLRVDLASGPTTADQLIPVKIK